ncbi:hypothetical protein FH972_023669 [Carpinus fangiana]|uniref:Probable magnesium transporter n=1 Tax=Carpinus fangiana TaxID=176857 RepID=A0A5N6KY42_9ROSI|nr:hypothetical protein FH972_023669 [Carpinus fangiana]
MYIPEQFEPVLAILKGTKEPPGGWSSLIGIVTAIVGNILISFALNTQRYAHLRIQREADEADESGSRAETPTQDHGRDHGHDRFKVGDNEHAAHAYGRNLDYEDADETDALLPMAHKDSASGLSVRSGSDDDGRPRQKSYLKSPYWWIGIGLMVVGEAGNFLAYGFAPASIVSPLGVVALISNCIVAPIMLHEQFRKRDALGVLIAVGGAVTVVLSAEGSNPKLGPDEIWDMVKRWEFLTYLGITVFLLMSLMVLSNKYGKNTILIDLGLVGLFGGYTALSTKGVSSLLSYRLWRVFTFPIFYILLVVLVGTAVMQVKYVNRALQRFDSTQVIPVQFVMFTISVIVGSAVLYRDFESATKDKVVQFLGGCSLTFLGVWLLTSGRKHDGDDQTHEGDEEEGITLEDEEAVENDILRPSPPSTPKPRTQSRSALASLRATVADSPASFATASSHLQETPQLPAASISTPSLSLDQSNGLSTSLPPPVEPASLRTPGLSPRRRPKAQQTSSDPRTPSSVYATPGPHAQGNFLTPDASANADRTARTLWPRHSISSIGNFKALTSPLSSGLSAVVADSLRRTESSALSRSKRGSITRSRKSSTSATQALNAGSYERPGAAARGQTAESFPAGGSSVAASSGFSSRRTSTADTDDGKGGKAPKR